MKFARILLCRHATPTRWQDHLQQPTPVLCLAIFLFLNASLGTSNSIPATTFTTVPLIPCEKLARFVNYTTWAATVLLSFCSQEHANHLTTKATDIPEKHRASWRKIDASLCSVLWFSIALISDLRTRHLTCVMRFGAKPKSTPTMFMVSTV